ncbi:hypothetical protein G2W53_010869 [Senna tora]|uniref:PB1-like domain-containing protein n=1 Tax=Senna tora TaxID=362788 RepID=A0A835CC72_9FABA|nr:hypothetical protein G2W53_010869 [Senna tora]
MDGYFSVRVHHGGTFENIHGHIDYRDGETTVLDNCDIDRWSFFEIKHGLVEMGHIGNYDMWFAQPNVRLDDTLKPIVDDREAMKMGQIGLAVGIVDLYLLHTDGEGDIDDGDEDSDGGDDSDDTDDGDDDNDDGNKPPPIPEPHTLRLSDEEYVANEGEATEDEGHEDDEGDQSGSDYDSDDDTDAISAAGIKFNDSEEEDVEKDFFDSVDGAQEQRTKRRMDKASVQPEPDSAGGTQERRSKRRMDKPVVQPEPDSAFRAQDSEDNVAVPTGLSSSKVRGLNGESQGIGKTTLSLEPSSIPSKSFINVVKSFAVFNGRGDLDPVVKFQRLYFCLDACKKSFLTCREIIGLDGCQLLSVVGRDPNDQKLPLAFAVVESESKDTWSCICLLTLMPIYAAICKEIICRQGRTYNTYCSEA